VAMPKTRTLLVALVAGVAVFVLFAFTIVGLVGEALVVLSITGLLLGMVVAAARHARHGQLR